MSAAIFEIQSPRPRLPLVTLYVTERCNSRCVSCDYWRSGRIDVDLEAVERLVRSLQRAGTRLVVLSGGEPLIHPEWQSIARLLKSHGLEVWLLTSGLSLAKHARSAAALFEVITVSLDGTDRDSYAAIRGLDAFDKVCEGIRATARRGRPANLRITLQRANYRRLAEFVDLAKHLGARQVSFLAVDLANAHAFGRSGRASSDLKLGAQDLPVFDELIGSLERRYAAEFHSGFIAESPQKLRTIWQYFAALEGVQAYPAVRCNAPEFSAVIDAHGRVQPCFFIKGPREVASGTDLLAALDGEPMSALRAEIRAGKRPECKTCVCSMWRDLGAAEERR